MESQFVYPPFLALEDQKLREKYQFRSTVQLTAQILWTARYFYFLSTSDDDLINYYLADANYMLGSARSPINLLYGLMNLCSIVSVVFTKFSTILQSQTHIYWLKTCEVFETGYFREIGEFNRELRILAFLKYFLLSVDSAVTVSSDINFFIQTPAKYLFWGISFALFHVFDAVIVTFYLVNRQPIYVFQMYLYAKYFIHLSNCIDQKLVFSMIVIEKYLNSHRDLIGLCKFYKQSNCLIFVLVAIMQVILCYYIFFSNIDLSAKMALMLILFAAHVCGMCGFFFIGTYLRNKVSSTYSLCIIPMIEKFSEPFLPIS